MIYFKYFKCDNIKYHQINMNDKPGYFVILPNEVELMS